MNMARISDKKPRNYVFKLNFSLIYISRIIHLFHYTELLFWYFYSNKSPTQNATLLEELPKIDLLQIKKSFSKELLELISELKSPVINPIVKIENFGQDVFVLNVPNKISNCKLQGLNG